MDGWIKLHRRIAENPLWMCEQFSRGQAWVDLLLLANFNKSFFYKRGVKIDVDRGQVARSEVELSDRWRWSRTKVRSFLNDLEKEQQIIQHKNNVCLLVTIVNFDLYQQEEQQTRQQKNSRKTAKEQQKNTLEEREEEREEKEEEEYISASDSSGEKPKPFNFLKALIDIGVSEQVAKDWIAVRKAKNATGTKTAFNRIHEQIKKSGLSADECISIAVERSWKGFNADWINGQTKQLPPPNINKAYERWDAASQTRYFGTQVIPYDAPPRPSNLEKWDDKNKKWYFSMN